MNLSELKAIKDGDEILFTIPFPPFTEGKKYVVTVTGTGRLVHDDNGLGRYIYGIENHFFRLER